MKVLPRCHRNPLTIAIIPCVPELASCCIRYHHYIRKPIENINFVQKGARVMDYRSDILCCLRGFVIPCQTTNVTTFEVHVPSSLLYKVVYIFMGLQIKLSFSITEILLLSFYCFFPTVV